MAKKEINPMLFRALNQSDPKKIDESLLNYNERRFLELSIRTMITLQLTDKVNTEMEFKELISLARKLGLDKGFIEKLKKLTF